MVAILLALVGAYLVGSLPTGYWLAYARGISDIRRHGSGNIGATNVARVLGLRFFGIVLLLDAGKAYFFMQLLAYYKMPLEIICLAALMLILGNSASVFLAFSGGKGVATALGIMLFLAPKIVLSTFIVWLIVLALSKTVGIASVVSASVLLLQTLFILYVGYDPIALTIAIIALWVVLLHKKNIRKMCQ